MCTQVVYTEVVKRSALILVISAGLVQNKVGFHRHVLESGEVRTHFLLFMLVDTEHGT